MKITVIFLFLISIIITLSSCSESPVEPETQFVQIYFKYNFKDELNTFDNSLQKDLVMDGVTKVKFWLTTEEQNRILEKAIAVNFFTMPDTFTYSNDDSTRIVISPDPGLQILRIKYQLNDKTCIWMFPIDEKDIRFKQLIELEDLIRGIIQSKKEYQSLPAARGGYD